LSIIKLLRKTAIAETSNDATFVYEGGEAMEVHDKNIPDVAIEEDRLRGRDADTPNEIPAKGLRDVFWRLVSEVIDDRATLIAAGVSFYILLSLFPALGALVALYGIIADTATMAKQIEFVSTFCRQGHSTSSSPSSMGSFSRRHRR
jgi:hypothetical protein